MSAAEKCFAAGLYFLIRTEKSAHVQHVDAEGLTDEVAGVVDRDTVRRRAVAGQHEDPLESVLRDLPADVGDQRSQRGVPYAVSTRVNEDAADFVRTGLTVVERGHHHD